MEMRPNEFWKLLEDFAFFAIRGLTSINFCSQMKIATDHFGVGSRGKGQVAGISNPGSFTGG
jgi:hypothetical protein